MEVVVGLRWFKTQEASKTVKFLYIEDQKTMQRIF